MSRSRTPSRTPSDRDRRNGRKTRSRSPLRESRDDRRFRERSNDRGRSRSLERDGPAMISTKIVVEKLTKNVNEGHLQEIFGSYGPIKEIDLPMNRQFNTNRGTGYIIYSNTTSAESAISHMHEAQLDGAVINVSVVLPRRKFSRSPPPASRGMPPPYAERDRERPPPPPPPSYRDRGPPPGHYGNGPPRYRSPPPRRRSPPPPPRGYGRGPPPRDYDRVGAEVAVAARTVVGVGGVILGVGVPHREGAGGEIVPSRCLHHAGEEAQATAPTAAGVAARVVRGAGAEIGMAGGDEAL
ncbi:hypothetical protein MMC10_001440 [Thelotrema lepadinum]|nr:hypothetical protein [Thelotrema lepadinum]